MRDVIARLKDSRARAEDETRLRGRERGRAWAMDQAETVELERLEE